MAITEVNVPPLPPQPLPWLGPAGPALNPAPESAHSPPPQVRPRPLSINSAMKDHSRKGCSAHEISNI
jgi:hypothetical protein